MMAHRHAADEEAFGDLPGFQPLAKDHDDLALALTQRRDPGCLGIALQGNRGRIFLTEDLCENRTVHPDLALMYLFDRFEKRKNRFLLEYHAQGAEAQDTLRQRVGIARAGKD